MGNSSVPECRVPLRCGSHCSPGYFWEACWIKRRVVQPSPVSILDQADNPRRRVAHDGDSGVSSWAYPYATLLGGMRWWVQRDRLSCPLHGVESQSRPWGPCFTLASRGEALHPYGSQVIRDLFGLHPSSLAHSHFEGTDRSFALYAALPRADYYGHADSLPTHRRISGLLPTRYFRSRSHRRKGLPCSQWWTLQDHAGGGFPNNLYLLSQAPQWTQGKSGLSASSLPAVMHLYPAAEWLAISTHAFHTLAVPSGKVLRQGHRSP
jgi:hypothetical protein